MIKGIIFGALIDLQEGQNPEDIVKAVELVDGTKKIRAQTNLVRIWGELVREHPEDKPFVQSALVELKQAIESTDAVVETIDSDVEDDFFV